MKKLLKPIIVIALMLVSFVLQFWAWTYAPGQKIAETELPILYRFSWHVLSFPTFWFMQGRLVNKYFMICLVINSFLWGVMLYLIGLLIIKFRQNK